MFSVRQSSLLAAAGVEPGGNGGCGQFSPACVAANVVVHGVTGAGGRHRNAPIGGAAKGTPRYDVTPSLSSPQIGPSAVFTSVPSEHAGAACGAPTRARRVAGDVKAT